MYKLKKVTFNNLVTVILIPELKEFSEIKQDIWYDEHDFYNFYNEEFKRKKRIKIHKKYYLNNIQI